MNAGLSYLVADTLDTRPPMLIAAATDLSRQRAERWIEDSGWRTASFPIADAPARLRLQAAASGLWIELEASDEGEALDRLLVHANGEAAAGRMPTVIAAPASMIDSVVSRIDSSRVEILVDPGPVDRVSALALATASGSMPAALHDIAREPASQKLKQLSEEVGRIAASLARLSTGPDVASRPLDRPEEPLSDAPSVSGDTIRSVIRARRLRARYFDEELFADPAWDMLLDLLHAEIAQHRVPVSSLCIAAAVPATTALRWIKTMTDNGLLLRRADPHDGRRVFIELAPGASKSIRRYFADVGRMAVI